MALTTASTAREICQAIQAASATIIACSFYPRAPLAGTFFRSQPVPPNALGYLSVDLTPRRVDPNAVPFVPVSEQVSVALVNQKFSGATTATCLSAAVTAIEGDIASAITAAGLGEATGPRIRVLIGSDAAITKPTVNFSLNISRQIIMARDAGPLGRFA